MELLFIHGSEPVCLLYTYYEKKKRVFNVSVLFKLKIHTFNKLFKP